MVYFVHGNDRSLLDNEVRAMIKNFTEEERDNLTIYDADVSSFSMSPVLEDCDTISLFGESNKIILVRNPYFLFKNTGKNDSNYSLLENYFANASYFSTLIFYWDESTWPAKETNRFVKLLRDHASEKKVSRLDALQFKGYVKRDMEKRGIQVEKNAMDYLFARLPNDVSFWNKEAEKLELFNQILKKEDIDRLIPRQIEEDAFALTNALLNKNLEETLKAYSDQLALKHSPMELMGTIATSLRRYYYCLYYKSISYSNGRIKEITGLSEKQIGFITNGRNRFSYSRVLYLLNKLAEVDQNFKLGKRDIDLGLQLFFVEATR